MEAMNPSQLVNASKERLVAGNYEHSGISTDVYQFCYDPAERWNEGKVFHANRVQDLSFEGQVQAPDPTNEREAMFYVHGVGERRNVEEMLARSLSLRHVGIAKPYVGGYNTQILNVVSGYSGFTLTLANWLQAQDRVQAPTSIPPALRHMIRTAYQAILTMWEQGFTSEQLADPTSYHMIDSGIKIDPLRIRVRLVEENDEMPIRQAFGLLILQRIHNVWEDGELLDLVDLLNNRRAGIRYVPDAPVLLLPARREIMYQKFEEASASLNGRQLNWLQIHATPQAGWRVRAANLDPALQLIINLQAQRGGNGEDFGSAMRFARIVSAHYPYHFRATAEGLSGANVAKGRVDRLLKQVLPRLLSRRFNAKFERLPPPEGGNAAAQ